MKSITRFVLSSFLCYPSLLRSSSTRKRLHPQRPSEQAVVTGVFPSPPGTCLRFVSPIGLSFPTFELFMLVDFLHSRTLLPCAFVLLARQFLRKPILAWDRGIAPRVRMNSIHDSVIPFLYGKSCSGKFRIGFFRNRAAAVVRIASASMNSVMP